MGLFDKFFGNPKQRDVEAQLADAERSAKQRMAPLGEIAKGIVGATYGSYQDLAPQLGYSLEGAPSQTQIYVFYELLYFFMHMTMRACKAARLSEVQIERLQAYLAPVISSTAVDTFFLSWPEDFKSRMIGEFFDKLNDAECGYAPCDELMSKNPFDGKSLLGVLGVNTAKLVAALSGRAEEAFNPMHALVTAQVALKKLEENDLYQLVLRAARVLNSDLGSLPTPETFHHIRHLANRDPGPPN